jgi:hypothetical protein
MPKYPLEHRPDFAEGTPVNNATASAGTLTVDTNPTAGDTMTIGIDTYTFVANAGYEGEIEIGGTLGATQANIVAAVNGTDLFNVANPYASLGDFSTDESAVTPLKIGNDSNVATTETFTAGTNVFDAAALSGGVSATEGHKGSMLFDGANIYIATADNTWRKVAHSAL